MEYKTETCEHKTAVWWLPKGRGWEEKGVLIYGDGRRFLLWVVGTWWNIEILQHRNQPETYMAILTNVVPKKLIQKRKLTIKNK